VLTATLLLLQRAGMQHKALRRAFVVFSVLALLAISRELDNFFEWLLFDNAWKIPGAALAAFLIYYYCRHRTALHSQIRAVIIARGFMLMFAGFSIVMGFSRLIGQKIFWQAVMQENYLRIVKRVCEESCEFVGYCLILAGAFELLYENITSRPPYAAFSTRMHPDTTQNIQTQPGINC